MQFWWSQVAQISRQAHIWNHSTTKLFPFRSGKAEVYTSYGHEISCPIPAWYWWELGENHESLNLSLISKDSSSTSTSSYLTTTTILKPSTENMLHKNNNPPVLCSQPLYHQTRQIVISIQPPPPYPMTFQPNTNMPNLPSSNIHHQSMPALQSNHLNQLTSNSESDFMDRLVKQVCEQCGKSQISDWLMNCWSRLRW